VATGAFLPERAIANEELTQFPAAAIALIEQKTGVKTRRHAEPSQCTSDLAIAASQACLERAGCPPNELDAIVLATSSPDRIQPATATRVQERIGARRGFAFDLNSVCAGGVYALHVADCLIRAGTARKVLVVASEVYSRYLNPRDFSTYPYFGDGAAAVLLAAEQGERGVIRSRLGSDGSRDHVIQIPAGGTMMPFGRLGHPHDVYFKMRGREVYDFAVTAGTAVVEELLAECGLGKQEVAFVVPHQANSNVVNELAERLGIAREKFVTNLERYGNTAAASVLIGLDELLQSGRASAGDAIVLVAFGGGLSWGATLIRN
jgi:3-oxoacyl-[acyl-carrier-protein] synthase-3